MESSPSIPSLSLLERFTTFFVAAGALLLILPGIFILEFIRHTEADRTLIAWEMLERGDFIIPRILGSITLTKPPLFYWLVSASFTLFHNHMEWIARLPSVLSGTLLVTGTFLFVRAISQRKDLALWSAVILGTSPLFLQLSSAAEIDILFATCTALSLFGTLLAHRSHSFAWTIFAYTCAGLAFLTKGPFALVLVSGIDFLWFFAFTNRNPRAFVRSVFGFLLALTIASSWYFLAAGEAGWNDVFFTSLFEITRRFEFVTEHKRGAFFYLGSLFVGILPWSILSCYAPFWRTIRSSAQTEDLIKFSLLVVVSTIGILSLAEGKSSRYALLVYPFIAVALGELVSKAPAQIVLFQKSLSFRKILHATLAIALLARFVEVGIYAPYRNSTRSAKPVVQSIQSHLGQAEKLYIFDLKERWVNYYLKRNGHQSFRLTPTIHKELLAQNTTFKLLLSNATEQWTIPHMRDRAPETRILQTFSDNGLDLTLLETHPRALADLPLKEHFLALPFGIDNQPRD